MKNKNLNIFPLRNILLIISVMIFLCIKSNAQNISWIGHLEEKEGLSDRIVDYIVRDNLGYFYFITLNSIQRFDGKKITNIQNAEWYVNNESEIQNINLIDDHPFFQIENNPSVSFYINKNQLNSLDNYPMIESSAPGDSIFISGNHKTSYKFQKINNKNYRISDFLSSEVLIDGIAVDFLPEKSYLVYKDQILLTENREGELDYFPKKTIIPNFPKNGKIVMNGETPLIYTIDGIFQLKNFQLDTLHSINQTGTKILWAKADKKNNVLIAYSENIATIRNLYLLKSDGELITYNNILSVSENIKDVYAEDFQKELMLATYNGVFILFLQNNGVNTFFVKQGIAASEFGHVISGVCWSPLDSSFYFTREREGLFRLKNKQIDQVNQKNTYKNNHNVAVSKDSSKIFNVSYNFQNGGMFKVYDIASSTSQQYELNFTPLTFVELANGKVLIGGTQKDKTFLRESGGGHLASLDLQSGKLTTIQLADDLKANQIRALLQHKNENQIWIGTVNGLYLLDNNYQIIRYYNNRQNEQDYYISEPHVRMIKQFGDKLFIGTLHSGLYIINTNTGQIQNHISKELSGLTANSIISSEIDHAGNYWLGSFSGMNVLNHKLEVIKKLHISDGLSNPEFNTMSSAKDDQGHLIFGTLNGLSFFEPDSTLKNTKKFIVNVEKITVYKNGSKKELFENLESISISEKTDSLLIQYNIPDYYKHYYTVDKDFFEASSSDNLNYTFTNPNNITIGKLSPGNYTLGLKPKDNSLSTDIEIHVRRYLIPWIVGLSILGLTLGLWYLFVRQKIKSNQKLEEEKTKFNKKLAQLELTALRAQMNPHFIFNALGAIQYFINTHDIDKADDYLTKFAKLMRAILESTKSKFIKLDEEINMLKLYTSLEHIRFEEKFEFRFDIDPKLNLSATNIPSMLIQPFIENAINHGLYHLNDRKGLLIISFKEINEDHILCEIIDNGIGRKAASQKINQKMHKSRGMQIVNERIDAIKLADNYEIDVQISDNMDAKTGTVVRISIKENN